MKKSLFGSGVVLSQCWIYIKWIMLLLESEAATLGILSKKLFLKILQISQENTCARVSFLIKLHASG